MLEVTGLTIVASKNLCVANDCNGSGSATAARAQSPACTSDDPPYSGHAVRQGNSLGYTCAVARRAGSACARRRCGKVGVDQHDPAVFGVALDEVGSTCAEKFYLGALSAMPALSASSMKYSCRTSLLFRRRSYCRHFSRP